MQQNEDGIPIDHALADPAPTDMPSYLARFARNQKITGTLFATTMHVPCPFCAARSFMTYRILDSEAAIPKGGDCAECGRSMRAVLTRDTCGVSVQFFQTAGRDQEAWFEPKMPRAVDTDGFVMAKKGESDAGAA